MNGAVAVVGGTNQVAAYLVPRLLEVGAVMVASRRPRPPWIAADPRLHWVRDTAPQSLRETPLDRLIYLAPLGLFERFAPWLSRGASVVCFSSSSVISKAESGDPAERRLATELAEGECLVRQVCSARELRCTVLRPTLIYGAGLDRNLTRVARFIMRWRCMPVLGPALGRRQPVHAEDLAVAAISALTRPAAAGDDYLLAGGSTLPYREMLERVFASLGLTPRIFQVPRRLASAAAALGSRLPGFGDLRPAMLERMNRDLVYDDGPARKALAYAPREFRPDAATWIRLDRRELG